MNDEIEKAAMRDAPRDGTIILAHIRADLPPRWPEHESAGEISAWADRWAPIKHGGVIDRSDEGRDPIDMGWTIALPVGYGGINDNWFDAWVPLPSANAALEARVRELEDGLAGMLTMHVSDPGHVHTLAMQNNALHLLGLKDLHEAHSWSARRARSIQDKTNG